MDALEYAAALAAENFGVRLDEDDLQAVSQAYEDNDGLTSEQVEEFVGGYVPSTYDLDEDDRDDDWDDDVELADDEADELARDELQDVAEQAGRKLIGRPLSTDELVRLSNEVDTDVTPQRLRAAAEHLGIRRVEDMTREQHNEWMVERAGADEYEPPERVLDVENSTADLTDWMVARVHGVEFEDVYGEAS